MGEWPLVKAAGILRRREWCDEKSAIEDLCASNCLLWRLVSLEKRTPLLAGSGREKGWLLIRAAHMVGYIKLRKHTHRERERERERER